MSTGAKGRQAEMQSQDILHLVTQQLQWHTNISPDQVLINLSASYTTIKKRLIQNSIVSFHVFGFQISTTRLLSSTVVCRGRIQGL